MSRYPSVPLGTLIKVHYGKALKAEERDDTGNFDVYGSSGKIGKHHSAIVKFPTIIIGRKGSVGAVTYAPSGGWTIDTAFYTEILNSDVLDLSFLFYALNLAKLAQHAITTSIPGLNRDDIYSTEIPLPPLLEQKRIAAILDKADSIRRKRQEAVRLTEELQRSVFLDMFGNPVTNPKGWEEARLEDVAEIVSGVTKGRKLDGKQTFSAPYLRVANVQDGYLDLTEIKEIEVLPSDIAKYRLLDGDILLTEGGDPDKLGRGTVWRAHIEDCIHQNHIFRVRIKTETLRPDFLSVLLGSERGKRYFLRAAKQTTGIASINSTQLKNFPVLIPTLDLQQRFAKSVVSTQKLKNKFIETQYTTNSLFSSLLQRAFMGFL